MGWSRADKNWGAEEDDRCSREKHSHTVSTMDSSGRNLSLQSKVEMKSEGRCTASLLRTIFTSRLLGVAAFTQIPLNSTDHDGMDDTLFGRLGSYNPNLLPFCYQSMEKGTTSQLSGKIGLLPGKISLLLALALTTFSR